MGSASDAQQAVAADGVGRLRGAARFIRQHAAAELRG